VDGACAFGLSSFEFGQLFFAALGFDGLVDYGLQIALCRGATGQTKHAINDHQEHGKLAHKHLLVARE